MSKGNEPVSLTYEEAVAMLPDTDQIHTFRNASFMLIGADWKREDVLSAIREHGAGLSGPQATAMKHGIYIEDSRGHLFIETKAETEKQQ